MNRNCKLDDLFKNKKEWIKEYDYINNIINKYYNECNMKNPNNIYEQLFHIEDRLVKLFDYCKINYNIDLKNKFWSKKYQDTLELINLYNVILTIIVDGEQKINIEQNVLEETYNSFVKLNHNNSFTFKNKTINSATFLNNLNENKQYKDIIIRNYYKYYKLNSDEFSDLLIKYVNQSNTISKKNGFKNTYYEFLKINKFSSHQIKAFIKNIKKSSNVLKSIVKIKKNQNNELISLSYLDIANYSNLKFSYTRSIRIILSSLAILGEDYLKVVKKIIDEGWIDSKFNHNKNNIPMCINCKNNHPYIIINYAGTLKDLTNLTHELGHAINIYYSLNSNKNSMLSEIPSIFHEFLLINYLIKEKICSKDDIREFLLDKIRNDYFRQAISFEMESYLYNNKMIDKGELLSYYIKILNSYYGNCIEISELEKHQVFSNPNLYKFFNSLRYPIGIIGGYYFYKKTKNSNMSLYLEFLQYNYLDIDEYFKKYNINFLNKRYINNFVNDLYKYIRGDKCEL